MAVEFNPFDPDTIENPYPAYRALRESGPIHHLEAFDLRMVSRYEDVLGILRDPETYSSYEGWKRIQTQVLGREFLAPENDTRNMIATDPPDHTRLRRIVSRGFTPKMLMSWEPKIRSITGALLDALLDKSDAGPVDIHEEFFSIYPVTVMAMVLGIEPDRRRDFAHWVTDVLSALSIFADADTVDQANKRLTDHFGEVVRQRIAEPRDDLLSVLVAQGDAEADPLTFNEIVGFAVLLLLGGTETTANLLSNWLAAMLAHPEAEAALRANHTKIPDCVEETLRYDGVPQMIWRAPTKDVEIGGVAVPKGATLGVMLGSANRDQAKWGPDADEFHLGRDATGHVGFGSGPHVCLGAHLGRLEMRVAIEELLDRTTSIAKAGPFIRSPNYMLRGHKSMPVELKART